MARLDRSTMATIAILGVPTVAVLLFTWFDRGSAADPPAVVARKVEATPAPDGRMVAEAQVAQAGTHARGPARTGGSHRHTA